MIRILAPGDEPALTGFFARHPDTTLFFQSNVAAAGLGDGGEPYSGRYAAAFEAGRVTALAGHAWNGNVLVEAPTALAEVVGAAVRATGRPVGGISGARAQVEAARAALGLAAAPAYMDSTEDLFALELARLQVPAALASGAWRVRAPHGGELPGLAAWRYEYRATTLGEPVGDALRAKCREELARYQREAIHFVLEAGGETVAYSAFNASTPGCVQIGGVWTPPALRSRGYARAVVAGSLLAARRRGVRRSVLFTPTDNHAAQAAYRALGYERVGDYGLVLFATPQRISG